MAKARAKKRRQGHKGRKKKKYTPTARRVLPPAIAAIRDAAGEHVTFIRSRFYAAPAALGQRGKKTRTPVSGLLDRLERIFYPKAKTLIARHWDPDAPKMAHAARVRDVPPGAEAPTPSQRNLRTSKLYGPRLGIAVHAELERVVKDRRLSLSGLYAKRHSSRLSFYTRSIIAAMEREQIVPHVAEQAILFPEARLATSIDLLATVKGKLVIVDYKVRAHAHACAGAHARERAKDWMCQNDVSLLEKDGGRTHA